MNDLIQLNNGEWVTKKEYIQLRSAIDEISKKLNKEQNGKTKDDKYKILV